MQIAMVGLGKMGGNMARRLMQHGHDVVAFDLDPSSVAELAAEGAVGAASLEELVGKLTSPRVAWVMVPAGAITESVVSELRSLMEPGDIVIDGGNSFYKDDVRRSRELAKSEIHHVDVGTSGGIWGVERGYCMMIGGEGKIVEHLAPVFESLAPGVGDIPPTPGREGRTGTAEHGYLYCGPSGAGHFVKMIHNGIEYGLMQAYAEGFGILQNANSTELAEEYRYEFAVDDIAEVWRRGSVVGSWLLDLTASALAEDPALSEYTGFVHDSGEGRWTIQAAIEEAVPAPVLSSALFARFRSRQETTFADKVLSAMRNKFGGHVEKQSGD